MQEIEDFKIWCITRDPKDFPWATSDHAGTQPSISEKVEDWAKRLKWGSKIQRSAWEFATATDKQVVIEAMKWDSETGQPLGKVYVDQDGNEVDVGNRVFIPFHHPSAAAMAEDVFRRSSAN